MKNGLHLYLSNDLNILFDKLYTNVKSASVKNLFDRRWIVVQTDGMVRWLSLKFTEREGFFSNFNFLFPRNFILEILEILQLLDKEKALLDKKEIFLEILRYLQKSVPKELSTYIDDVSGKKCVQLALKLSDIFDQYITYRYEYLLNPDKIMTKWQRELFKKAVVSKQNIVVGIQKFLEDKFDKNLLEKIPDTINLFSISILPPIYINFLKKLSQFKRVNLYTINPSKSYWFEDLGEKARVYFEKKYGSLTDYFEDGNTILLNNGKMLQEFISLLYDMEPTPIEYEDYKDYDGKTALSALKQSIFENVKDEEIVNDDSIQVHSFHSKLREVEGVYNYILSVLDKDKSISLEDIVVMCSDINEYAPFIDAVFKNKDIKYNISDNSYLNDDVGIKGVFKILSCLREDLNVVDFLDMIENEAIRSKFDINQNELDAINYLINELNLRWGLSESEIKSLYENISLNNTFGYFYKRLMLGMFCGEDDIVDNVLPYTNIKLSQADLFGKLLYIINKIKFYYESFKEKVSLENAKKILFNIVDDFIGENFSNSASFLSFLSELEKIESEEIIVDLEGFLEILRVVTNNVKNSYNFMRGGITFCELVPLRSIPFKVVCMLGMTDENFPRKDVKLFINEMEKNRRKGDRNTKLSDRLLFLDTIISAEKYLYISFIGRDLKKNKIINPSLPVVELVDFMHLERIEHPLHSFNSKYFEENGKLFNYNEDDFKIASNNNLSFEKENILVLSSKQVGDEEKAEKIGLSKLTAFLRNPLKYYFKENGIDFEEETSVLESKEPLYLEKYDEYNFIFKILRDFKMIDKLEFSGDLPHANIGKGYLERIKRRLYYLDNLLKGVSPEYSLNMLNDLDINCKISEKFSLEGKIYYQINGNLFFMDFFNKVKDKNFQIEWVVKSLVSNKNSFYLIRENEIKSADFNLDFSYLSFIVDVFEQGKCQPIIFDDKIVDKTYEEFLRSLENSLSQKMFNNKVDNYLIYFVDNFEINRSYFGFLKEINKKLYNIEVNFGNI